MGIIAIYMLAIIETLLKETAKLNFLLKVLLIFKMIN